MDRQGYLWTPVPPSYLAVVDLDRRPWSTSIPPPGVGDPLGDQPSAPIQDPATGDLLVPEAEITESPTPAGRAWIRSVEVRQLW
jgi:hypothetical protein